jgi:hypothetical protein
MTERVLQITAARESCVLHLENIIKLIVNYLLTSLLLILYIAATKFLLFARKQEIRGVHIDRPYFSVTPTMTVPHVHSPVTLDYVPGASSSQNIYWTDDGAAGNQLGLHSANINGTVFDLLDSGRRD